MGKIAIFRCLAVSCKKLMITHIWDDKRIFPDFWGIFKPQKEHTKGL